MALDNTKETKSDKPLPTRIPIFPLSGVLLFPKARLPLNIFEPRYLEMVQDAMASDRLIGMIQPLQNTNRSSHPSLYQIGGAGRITSFEEMPEKQFRITLTGVSRFSVVEELSTTTSYRQIVPDWDSFVADRRAEDAEPAIDRTRLLNALRSYLDLANIPAEWDTIASAEIGALITSLAMICPFDPAEKQALLEARDLNERSQVITALVEMALLQKSGGSNRANQGDDNHQIH